MSENGTKLIYTCEAEAAVAAVKRCVQKNIALPAGKIISMLSGSCAYVICERR